MARGFCVALSLWAFVVGGAAAWVLDAPLGAAWGLAAAALVAVPGLWKPRLMVRPYRAWDRAAQAAARAAHAWLSGVCLLIVTIVGRAGSRLPWRRRPNMDSGWTPKPPSPPGSYSGPSVLRAETGRDDPWLRPLLAWARGSGNGWIWALVPALALLAVVEGSERSSLGGDIYTLY